MKYQSRNERKFLILGVLIGIFVSGLIALIFSFSLTTKQNKNITNFKYPGEFSSQPILLHCLNTNSDSMNNKININTASIEELDTLPGIGEVKATGIIEFRQKYGNFKTIDELLYVSGISETTFQQICNSISISHP